MNRYFEEINGNKYLTLVLTNESKGKIKKYIELWSTAILNIHGVDYHCIISSISNSETINVM